jgi:hypothetical protein
MIPAPAKEKALSTKAVASSKEVKSAAKADRKRGLIEVLTPPNQSPDGISARKLTQNRVKPSRTTRNVELESENGVVATPKTSFLATWAHSSTSQLELVSDNWCSLPDKHIPVLARVLEWARNTADNGHVNDMLMSYPAIITDDFFEAHTARCQRIQALRGAFDYNFVIPKHLVTKKDAVLQAEKKKRPPSTYFVSFVVESIPRADRTKRTKQRRHKRESNI